jgi:hypothetical protein
MCDRRILKKASTVTSYKWLFVGWKFEVRSRYKQQNLVPFLKNISFRLLKTSI